MFYGPRSGLAGTGILQIWILVKGEGGRNREDDAVVR